MFSSASAGCTFGTPAARYAIRVTITGPNTLASWRACPRSARVRVTPSGPSPALTAARPPPARPGDLAAAAAGSPGPARPAPPPAPRDPAPPPPARPATPPPARTLPATARMPPPPRTRHLALLSVPDTRQPERNRTQPSEHPPGTATPNITPTTPGPGGLPPKEMHPWTSLPSGSRPAGSRRGYAGRVARLAAMGLTSGQAGRLVVLEAPPAVLAAVAAGAAGGWALAPLTGSALDLSVFTGGTASVPIRADVAVLVVPAAGLVVLAPWLSLFLQAALARRRGIARAPDRRVKGGAVLRPHGCYQDGRRCAGLRAGGEGGRG